VIVFYIYFSYVLLLSGLVLLDCIRKKNPRWWAAMVLLAPVTTPYVIFTSRKTSGMILFMLFLTSFSVVVGAELYVWAHEKEKNKYAHLPPVTTQVIRLCDNLKQSTAELDTGLVQLEYMSKVESNPEKLQQTIAFIKSLRLTLARNQDAIDRLVKFTTDYKEYFMKKELYWIYQVRQYYTNRHVVRHVQSLETYLNDFHALLTYTYANFSKIADQKDPESMHNYDEYYLRYRRAVDRHNAFNVQRIEFQNDFVKKHPAIKAYLPGERQTETFRLWE